MPQPIHSHMAGITELLSESPNGLCGSSTTPQSTLSIGPKFRALEPWEQTLTILSSDFGVESLFAVEFVTVLGFERKRQCLHVVCETLCKAAVFVPRCVQRSGNIPGAVHTGRGATRLDMMLLGTGHKAGRAASS
ncbi:hypothetical protein BaRGS_00017872, partial [Batillaria attramentaria]